MVGTAEGRTLRVEAATWLRKAASAVRVFYVLCTRVYSNEKTILFSCCVLVLVLYTVECTSAFALGLN